MDDDKSKSLDLEEFLQGLQDAGVSLGRGEVEEIFHLCDKNKSGTLDLNEFLEMLRVSGKACPRYGWNGVVILAKKGCERHKDL